MTKPKKNKYIDKIHLMTEDGKPLEEIGSQAATDLIVNAFMKVMFDSYKRGEFKPNPDFLKNRTFIPLSEWEKYAGGSMKQ